MNFIPGEVAIIDDAKLITAPDQSLGSLGDFKLSSPLIAAEAAKGFLDTAKELNPSSSAESGDAFSGNSPVIASFSTGDVFNRSGSKGSVLTTAIIGAVVLIGITLLTRKRK